MAKSIGKRVITAQYISLFIFVLLFSSSCAIQKAQRSLLNTPALKGAHVGIAIYNDTKSAWIDQRQSDHYYTPASNTKILATYVGLQFLGDSIPGWKMAENADTLFLFPQGDPSFLHPEFTHQPIVDLIQQTNKQVVIATTQSNDRFESMGDGWAWNDYAEDYQPERSRMPIYGNVVHFYEQGKNLQIKPFSFFKNQAIQYEEVKSKQWSRKKLTNDFFVTAQKNNAKYFQVPFISDPEKDIQVYINSPGGSVYAGMAIYDTMQQVRPDVGTICYGIAASMGAFLLSGGAKGKRLALPNARMMIHQPLGGAQGQASDIQIQAQEILYIKKKLNELLADHTGQPIEKVSMDTDRDFYMSSQKAVEYGLIDQVISKPGIYQPEVTIESI